MDIAMLKYALTKVVSSEFADVPENEDLIEIQPSLNFKKKMEKLIKKEKRVIWHYTNTAYKRVAIMAAVLVMMFATACSVSAIREPIVEFFTEVYDSFTRYFFEGDTVDRITSEFEITSLPEEFELSELHSDDTTIRKIYTNKGGELIIFSQQITSGTDFRLDAENGIVKTFSIDNVDFHLYIQEDLTKAIWIKEGYLLSLSYHGDISEQEIKALVLSVDITTK